MKYSLIVLIVVFFSCDNESKRPQSVPLEVSKPQNKSKIEQEPTYSETVDWILEKTRLYAKGYERDFYKTAEFEEFYPKVKMAYTNINILYGKIIITENYRYSGANVSKENNYNGYMLRQNVQEIPINDIEQISLYKGKFFCNLQIQVKKSTVKFTRNMQTTDSYNPDLPKPIVEYSDKGGIYFRCEVENDLENRLISAFTRLKKLNLKRYPIEKEKF